MTSWEMTLVLLLLLALMQTVICLLQRADPDDGLGEQRAEATLKELLTDEERLELSRCGYLTVPSPSGIHEKYRIPVGPGCVDVYDSGELSMKLCVQPVKPLPPSDIVLMHKLMIEGNEEEYLRAANVQWSRGIPSRYDTVAEEATRAYWRHRTRNYL